MFIATAAAEQKIKKMIKNINDTNKYMFSKYLNIVDIYIYSVADSCIKKLNKSMYIRIQ